MNNKTLFFSKNLIYNLGGAEHSLLSEIKSGKYENPTLCYAKQDNNNIISDYNLLNIPSCPIYKPILFSRFFYYEYFINKTNIRETLNAIDYSLLVAQNLWAPIAINHANSLGKKTIYYLRDEKCFGDIFNYNFGAKYYLGQIYRTIEKQAINKYIKENYLALKCSTKIISNSNFMSARLWDKYKIDSIVNYPNINISTLRSNYSKYIQNSDVSNDGIVIIGDTKIKGIDLFIEISKYFPNQNFYIFGKNKNFEVKSKNVFHMGWSVDPAYPFSRAKIVLVPSLWNEAYGRVAAEALALNIPVIVANKGGLPEAVNYDQNLIANNIDEFIKKMRCYI